MSEHAEDPAGQASTKVVQYVSLVTMAAEAIAQVRQQRAAVAATADLQAAGAARAQHEAAHASARLRWAPVLNPERRSGLDVTGTGLAWAAAQAWRPFDPEAELATERAQDRLRQLRPDVMERFDRLRCDGVDPVEAMRRVAPFFDRPLAREGQTTVRAALVDTPLGAGRDLVLLTEATQASGAGGDVAEHPQVGGFLAIAVRTAPEIAKDGYPEPLSGQVLAAGRVKPRTPDRTAPAAVRSNSLATAARASSGRTR